jgi:signal transduction histidine kinase/DNA-binding response OmpR family regulator
MRTWATDAFGLDAVDGSVYVDQAGLGLSRIEGDALRPIPGGERFADITIFTMLPFGDGRVLLGTRSDGLWLYDPAATRFVRFRTEADEILAAGRIYVPGAVLPGGRFAFGTRAAGLVVIDREGRLLLHLGADDGLASNDVGFVYLGRAGDLWLAHRRGLSRVEIDAPFTAFDARSGLPAQVDEMARYEGRLYASTMDGLYRLEPGSRAFRRIEGPTGWTRGLYPTDDGLFIRSYGGDAWRVVGDELQAQRTPFPESDGTNALVHWGRDADWWLVGHDTGLDVVRWDGGRWVREGAVRGVEADVTSIAQDPAGVVWLGTTSEAVVRVQFTEPDDPLAGADVTTFGVEDGLPDVDSRTYRIGSDVYAAAVGGDVFRFDAAASRFVPDPAFDVVRSGHPLSFFALSEGPDGSVWVAQQFGRPARLKPAGGGRYVDASGSLGRLRESLVNGVYPEDDGVAWLMGLEHLVRYDAQADAADASAPTPFFRRVEAGNRVIYGGVGALTDVEVAPDAGTVRFEFAAARYDGVLYRTRLDGLENTWTAWSPESERVFTGLGTGQYALRVQAQGASGEAGPEGVYAFTMLPPPWRTWWAYLGYGLLAVGGLTVAYRARRRRHRLLHRMEMEQLEADKLRELDHARSRFFANVSHEFRTPLTLTIGPLDDVQAGLYGPLDAPLAQQVDLARRNAGRVLDLINQILDVARLESGRTPLRARPLDLGAFVGSVAEPLQAMAERKAMAFEIHRPAAPVEVYADPEQLEKAVTNLLSNALKFTPESGTVRVEVAAEDGMARVAVRDSGPGIPATDLPHVFDRFYQVGGSAQTQLGTGIGLALAKEVVDLHGGTLTVASEEGFGSTFTFTLPLGQAHLAPKQIVDDEPWAPGAARQAPSAEGSGDGFDSEGVAVLDEDADVTTVLVVEDHPEVRAYVRRHLEAAADGRPAYRVLEAADGEAGLVLAKARLPDLVISDVMMPKLDGLGLCRALKADPETDFIPVILLTAKAAPEDKLEGLSEHCDDYLTKPFDVAELRARIANLIAVRTRLRERFRQEGSTSAPGDAPTSLRLPAPEDLTSADDAFLKVVAKAIEVHLGDETFSVERLAEAVGVSRGHLHRKLKALAGQTPTDLIRTVRLERATHLLAGRAGTVSEIAYAVGFKSVGHFSDSFVRAYGCRPSDYAARAEAAEDEPAR